MLNYMTGSQNAFLVKRKTGGGVQFSRDPYNLMNTHSRKVSLSALKWRMFC
jgi:hypothetical protein